MKRSKKQLLLMVVLLLLLAGAVGALYLLKNPKETPQSTESASQDNSRTHLITDSSTTDVAKMTVENASGTFTIVRVDQYSFSCEEVPEMPVNASEATALAASGCSEYLDLVEESASDLSVYGLDKPEATILYTLKDGRTVRVLFGSFNDYTNTYYVMTDESPRVLQASKAYGERARKSLAQYSGEPFPAFARSYITYIGVKGNGHDYELSSVVDKPQGYLEEHCWYDGYTFFLRRADGVEVASDPDGTVNLGDAIEAVTVDSVITYSDDPEVLAQYNLTGDTVTHFTITQTDDTLSTFITHTWHLGQPTEDGSYYAMYDDSKAVFRLEPKAAADLLSRNEKRVYNRLPTLVYIMNIESIEVDYQGKHFTAQAEIITTEDGKQDLGVCTINGSEVDKEDYRDFFTNCVVVTGDRAMADGEEVLPVDPEIRVTVHTTLANFPTLVYEYTPYNGSFYEGTINGDTTILFNRTAIGQCKEYIEKYLP